METIDAYSSSSDAEESSENIITGTKKIIRTPKEWLKVATFDTAEEAESSLGKDWSKDYKNNSEEGKKQYYRCKKAKKSKKCSARYFILYHSNNLKATVYKTAAEHDHINSDKLGVSEETKEIIEQLVKDGIRKPNRILAALEARKVTIPKKSQLVNFIANYKRREYGEHTISLGELEEWCVKNSVIPEDENTAFVSNYMVSDNEFDDDEDVSSDFFGVFITTKRLLDIASRSKHIHADATYKLIWQGFPILIVGTTDYNKAFHHFGLAVCRTEDSTAFEFIFNSVKKGLFNLKKQQLEN